MINKKDQSDPIDNLEYEKVLEEAILWLLKCFQ